MSQLFSIQHQCMSDLQLSSERMACSLIVHYSLNTSDNLVLVSVFCDRMNRYVLIYFFSLNYPPRKFFLLCYSPRVELFMNIVWIKTSFHFSRPWSKKTIHYVYFDSTLCTFNAYRTNTWHDVVSYFNLLIVLVKIYALLNYKTNVK